MKEFNKTKKLQNNKGWVYYAPFIVLNFRNVKKNPTNIFPTPEL